MSVGLAEKATNQSVTHNGVSHKASEKKKSSRRNPSLSQEQQARTSNLGLRQIHMLSESEFRNFFEYLAPIINSACAHYEEVINFE